MDTTWSTGSVLKSPRATVAGCTSALELKMGSHGEACSYFILHILHKTTFEDTIHFDTQQCNGRFSLRAFGHTQCAFADCVVRRYFFLHM